MAELGWKWSFLSTEIVKTQSQFFIWYQDETEKPSLRKFCNNKKKQKNTSLGKSNNSVFVISKSSIVA